MSIIDTSTWNPDPALNESIGDIPLNESASIAQTWQAIQMLMAAGGLHGLQLVTFEGATASADGSQGLVPAPEAGDQNKVLKGDGTWEVIGVASVDGLQTALNAKANDSDVVHTAGAETVSGTKTFTSNMVLSKSDPTFILTNSGSSGNTDLAFKQGGSTVAVIRLGYNGLLQIGRASASGGNWYNGARIAMFNSGDMALYVRNDDGSRSHTLSLSTYGSLLWDGDAIQTSSDERLKTPLSCVPDEVLDAWEAVGWGQFRFLDAVERKGANARFHLGLIAQRVKAVFEARGLDACAYGILCHEESEATDETPAVDLWMVRYTEALAMEAACQRRRADRLEARIAALEEAMNA